VRFTIFAQNSGQDFSAFPATLRGSLNGTGNLDVQLDISLPGPLGKAELEDRCERLPALAGGSYSARVKVEIATEVEDVA
jgi:hypothetical protein